MVCKVQIPKALTISLDTLSQTYRYTNYTTNKKAYIPMLIIMELCTVLQTECISQHNDNDIT